MPDRITTSRNSQATHYTSQKKDNPNPWCCTWQRAGSVNRLFHSSDRCFFEKKSNNTQKDAELDAWDPFDALEAQDKASEHPSATAQDIPEAAVADAWNAFDVLEAENQGVEPPVASAALSEPATQATLCSAVTDAWDAFDAFEAVPEATVADAWDAFDALEAAPVEKPSSQPTVEAVPETTVADAWDAFDALEVEKPSSQPSVEVVPETTVADAWDAFDALEAAPVSTVAADLPTAPASPNLEDKKAKEAVERPRLAPKFEQVGSLEKEKGPKPMPAAVGVADMKRAIKSAYRLKKMVELDQSVSKMLQRGQGVHGTVQRKLFEGEAPTLYRLKANKYAHCYGAPQRGAGRGLQHLAPYLAGAVLAGLAVFFVVIPVSFNRSYEASKKRYEELGFGAREKSAERLPPPHADSEVAAEVPGLSEVPSIPEEEVPVCEPPAKVRKGLYKVDVEAIERLPMKSQLVALGLLSEDEEMSGDEHAGNSVPKEIPDDGDVRTSDAKERLVEGMPDDGDLDTSAPKDLGRPLDECEDMEIVSNASDEGVEIPWWPEEESEEQVSERKVSVAPDEDGLAVESELIRRRSPRKFPRMGDPKKKPLAWKLRSLQLFRKRVPSR
eukprot:s3445_g4.t5